MRLDLNVVVNTVFILWSGSEIILARVKRSSASDKGLDRNSLRAIWATIFVSIGLGVLFKLTSLGNIGYGSQVYPIVGLVLILCGLAVRWVAILSLKRQFTVDVAIVKDHRLFNRGLYRHVRHPAYAGSLLSFLGLGLSFANWLSLLVIFLPVFSALLYRIRIEEKALRDRFGREYEDYCASTRRLIPGIY